MKTIKLYLIFGLSIIFFSACKPVREEVKIAVIESSDVHGAGFPIDFISGDNNDHSLAHLASFIKQQRGIYPDRLILLDNGDLIQGDPSSYYYNYIDTVSEHLYARMLNYMGYDAATVGNHDIEAGHSVYDRFKESIDMPWLAANAVNKVDGKPYFQPYTMIEKAGIRLAVLGLITPAIPEWLPEKLWSGMYFEDMATSAKHWMEIIQEEEKPDIVIGLFHAGADTSQGNYGRYNENASTQIARQVPGFDLILVGHDHRGWNMKVEGPEGDSVLILSPTSKARNVAFAEIRCYPVNKHEWEVQVDGKLVDMNTFSPDSAFLSTFKNDILNIQDFVDDSIAYLEEDLYAYEAMLGPSAFTSLIHQAQKDISGATISFTAPLSSTAVLKHGRITIGDLFALYRYENLLYKMELSGSEIDAYLEYSVNGWFDVMDSPDETMLAYETTTDGQLLYKYSRPVTEEIFYNFSSASGLIYELDLKADRGDRIRLISTNSGQDIHPDSTYIVAVNSYRGSGGGGHLTHGAGITDSLLVQRVLWSSEKDLRFELIDWFRRNSPVAAVMDESWRIVPTDWYRAAREREEEYWSNRPR